MQNEKTMNLERFALETMLDKARGEGYAAGRRDACPGTLMMGAELGAANVMAMFDEAATVKAVYRNGDYTVLEFADGSKEKVRYQPEYGYAYDHEKAIMACMLKRLTGNRYIKALKEFTPKNAVRKAANNTGREMIPRHDWHVKEPADPDKLGLPEMPEDPKEYHVKTCVPDPDTEPEAKTGLMDAGEEPGCDTGIIDEEELFARFGGMAEEPGFDQPLFDD